ncbi:MAG: YigZ family protein [Melioribacteraceae bacterium]|jgi:uncharacterized YigZ family protein|nr:YigZ family protein [Melioribacteraceae bacterium]
MDTPSIIKTIPNFHEFRFKEKGSLFIGQTYNITSEEGAEIQLKKIKKEFYEATHRCFSLRLIDGTFKYSDDGEPSGTAGIRIYNAQKHFEVTNNLTLVIRYFGGTKLGVGPLGKAYYDSAFSVLNEAKVVTLKKFQGLVIDYDFEQSSLVHNIIKKYGIKVISSNFDPSPKIQSYIDFESLLSFGSEMAQYSPRSIKFTLKENIEYFEV